MIAKTLKSSSILLSNQYSFLKFSTNNAKNSKVKEKLYDKKYVPYEVGEPIVGATYFWCSCGKTKTQPFCDSSHIGTEFKPIPYKTDKYVYNVFFCTCRKTKTEPICDCTCTKLFSDLKLSDNKPI